MGVVRKSRRQKANSSRNQEAIMQLILCILMQDKYVSITDYGSEKSMGLVKKGYGKVTLNIGEEEANLELEVNWLNDYRSYERNLVCVAWGRVLE